MNGVIALGSDFGGLVAGVVHHIDVVTDAAHQGVGPRATVQGVVAIGAGEGVDRAVAGQAVGQCIAGAVDGGGARQGQVFDVGRQGPGGAGRHRIGAFVQALEHHVSRGVHHIAVVAQAAHQAVGACPTVQAVITRQAIQGVVTACTTEGVLARTTRQGVGIGRAGLAQVGHADVDVKHVRCGEVAGVASRHAQADAAGRSHRRCAREHPRGRVEGQPRRQRAAIGQSGAQGQGIASVRIGEGRSSHGVAEGQAFRCHLVGQGRGQHRGVVGRVDREVHIGAGRVVVVVGAPEHKLQLAQVGGLRRAREHARCGVKVQPGRHGRAIGHLHAVGDRIPGVRIGDRAHRDGVAEGTALASRQGRDGAHHGGCAVVGGAVHHGLQHGLIPHHAIAELHTVDLLIQRLPTIDRGGSVVIDEADLVRRVLDLEEQAVARLEAQHLAVQGIDAQGVGGRHGIEGVDAVLSIAFVEDVGVVARTALQVVVALAAGQHIGATVAPQAIGQLVARDSQVGIAIHGQALHCMAQGPGDGAAHEVIALTGQLDNGIACIVDLVVVVTLAADQGVGPVRAEQSVGPAAADQGVVARQAQQVVVSVVAGEHVVQVVAVATVDRAHQREVFNVGLEDVEGVKVTLDGVDAIAVVLVDGVALLIGHKGVVARTAVHLVGAQAAIQAVVARVAAQHIALVVANGRGIVLARELDALQLWQGHQAEAQAGFDGVKAAIDLFDDHIGQGVQHIGVIALSAHQGVNARATVQDVAAAVAGDEVVERIARGECTVGAFVQGQVFQVLGQGVAGAGKHQVMALASRLDHLVLRAVHQEGVVALATLQGVDATSAIEHVVAVAATHAVVRRIARQDIIGEAAMQEGFTQLVQGDGGAACRAVLEAVVVEQAIGQHHALEADAVHAALDLENDVGTLAAHVHVFHAHLEGHQHRVASGQQVVKRANDHVTARALLQDVEIVARTARQGVVARAAIQLVITLTARHLIST